MSTKNIESTAVNELIDLVQQGKPLLGDADDMMFAAPAAKPGRVKKLSPPRMTATVPPIRAAGEVAPLPRSRTPVGTQQGLPTLPPPPPPVRISTAPPSRAVTIPPLRPAPAADDVLTTPANPALRPTKPTLPPPVRQGAPPLPQRTPAPQRMQPPPRRTQAPATMPVAAPFESTTPVGSNPNPLAPAHLDMTSNAAWFDSSRAFALPSDEGVIGTESVQKTHPWKAITAKLIVPMIILVIVGIFIGGYLASDRGTRAQMPAEPSKIVMTSQPAAAAAAPGTPDEGAPATGAIEPAAAAVAAEVSPGGPARPDDLAPAAEPAPITPANMAAPAPAPTAEPIAPGPAKVAPPSIVDVLIESTPAGATVMLVDRGKTTFLGTTPVSAGVDPARTYELVFTYKDMPTQLEPLDPSKIKHLAVVLDKAGTRGAAKQPEATKAEPAVKAKQARAEKRRAPDRVIEKPVTSRPKKAARARPAGEGVLMISSKPPCAIFVDGKPTGLTTPQRSIPLPAGRHKVTLVNAAAGIKKTVAVRISADSSTKVIEDLMK